MNTADEKEDRHIRLPRVLWGALKAVQFYAPAHLEHVTRTFGSTLDEVALGNDELLVMLRKARRGRLGPSR